MKYPGFAEETFTDPAVVLDKSAVKTFAGSVSDLVLTYTSGTIPDTETDVVIPAGTVTTSLAIPATWGVEQPEGFDLSTDFDPDETYLIALRARGYSALGTIISGNLIRLETPDLSVPTVVSASGVADSATISVLFSKPVTCIDLAGISLSGTSLTITGNPTGQGSTTLAFPLDGNLAAEDEIDFVTTAPTEIKDGYDQTVGSSTTAVTIDPGVSMPRPSDLVQYFSSKLQTSAMATRVDDQSGNANHGSDSDGQGTALTTITSPGAPYTEDIVVYDMRGAANRGIQTGMPVPTGGGFTLSVRLIKLSSGTNITGEYILRSQAGGVGMGRNTGNNQFKWEAVGTSTDAGLATLFTSWAQYEYHDFSYCFSTDAGGTVTVYVDGVAEVTATGTGTPTAENFLAVGLGFFNHSCEEGVLEYARHINGELTSTEVGELIAYWDANL